MTPWEDPEGQQRRSQWSMEGEAEAGAQMSCPHSSVAEGLLVSTQRPPCREVLPGYGDKNSSCLVTFCHITLLRAFVGIMTAEIILFLCQSSDVYEASGAQG